MAKHGLAADNLARVELVTADGEVLDVTAESDPDLFWALRGGGGNFGIATTFTYRLHPLETVTGGLIAHPFDAAGEMLRFYRDAVADCPDELTVFAALVHAPDGSGTKLAAMVVCHTGTPSRPSATSRRSRRWGSPVDGRGRADAVPGDEHAARRGVPGRLAQLLAVELHARAARRAHRHEVERFASVPSPMSASCSSTSTAPLHGRRTDTAVPIAPRAGTCSSRRSGSDPAATEENIAWTRETHALRPHLDDRRWLNYLGDDQGSTPYAPPTGRLRRLVEVKRR